MESEKPKMESYQKVLNVLSWIVLTLGVVLFFLRITDVFDFGISLVVACTVLCDIFQSISLWKVNPKMYTWRIALGSFMLGFALMDVLHRLLD